MINKAKDLRDQSEEELKSTLLSSRRELYDVNNARKESAKVEKPHQRKNLRRNIARLKTVIREKELQSQEVKV